LQRPHAPWVIALVVALAALVVAPAAASAHRRIFIWFADGGLMPESGLSICRGRPSAFNCSFGASVADCRDQLMMWLERWYADFDVSFTFAPPPDSPGKTVAYDTILISHNGAWCGADATITSRSPLPPCMDLGGAALAVFKCDEPRRCAGLIAKEHGHLIGLQHTSSSTDVMFDEGAVDHDGFEDKDNRPTNAKCGIVQNSYRLMLARLGAWPGGPKPAADPPLPPRFPDGGAPEDAAPIDSAPPPEDTAAPTGGSGGPAPADNGGGCACRTAPAGAGGAAVWWVALPVGIALARRRWSRRR
jgi:hypothetical protein